MHRTLKYIYLHGKNVKRLDKAIHGIMRFVRDKMIDRLITANKGKLTSKIRDLRIRHKTSETLCLQVIQNENGWSVSSTHNTEIYNIHENNKTCTCHIQCTECNICIHRYICSCIDSSIRWNMCKHIHYLLQHTKTTTTYTVHNESPLIIDNENELILNEVAQKKSQTLSLEHRKDELKKKCLELIESLKSDKQCDVLDRILKSAPPQLKAADMANAQEIHFPTANKGIPPNKNIIPQRFSNANKKRKLTKTSTVTKQNEDNNTILKIILDHKNFTHSPTEES